MRTLRCDTQVFHDQTQVWLLPFRGDSLNAGLIGYSLCEAQNCGQICVSDVTADVPFHILTAGCGSLPAVGNGGDLPNTEKSVMTDGDCSAFRGTLSRNGVSPLALYVSTAGELKRRAFWSLPQHLRLEILASSRVIGQVA